MNPNENGNVTRMNQGKGIFGVPQMIMKLEITAEYQAENDKKGQLTPAMELSLSDADPTGIVYAALFQNLEELSGKCEALKESNSVLVSQVNKLMDRIKVLEGENNG